MDIPVAISSAGDPAPAVCRSLVGRHFRPAVAQRQLLGLVEDLLREGWSAAETVALVRERRGERVTALLVYWVALRAGMDLSAPTLEGRLSASRIPLSER